MSEHHPTGQHTAIHSVVVSPSLQRQGVAHALLKEYLKRLQSHPRYISAVLISHDNLIPLYQKAGFTLRGKSEVVHGSRPWYELAADTTSSSQQQVGTSQSATVSPGQLHASPNVEMLVDEHGRNKDSLYCPRGACKCLLLKAGAAFWVERSVAPVCFSFRVFSFEKARLTDQAQLLDQTVKPTPCPPDFPPPVDPEQSMIGYWSAQPPSALTFENVGFSKSLGSIKFLTCADCDCGPLGWHDTQGADLARDVEKLIHQPAGGEKNGSGGGGQKEFLLDAKRVRYGSA